MRGEVMRGTREGARGPLGRAWRVLLTALLAAVLVAAVGCGGDDDDGGGSTSGGGGGEQQSGPINIGAVGPLSGLYSIVGESQEAGIRLAMEDIGDRIGDREIVLHSEDDRVEVQTGVNAFTSLVSNEDIVAVFGSTVTSITEAMAQQIGAMEQPIPQVGVLGADSVVYPDGPGTDPRPWMFAVLTSTDAEIQKLIEYATTEVDDPRIGIIKDNTEYGEGIGRRAEQLLGEAGTEAVSVQTLQQNAPDPGPQVSRLVSAGANVIIIGTSQEDAARIARAREAQGSDAQLLCMTVCANFPDYRELGGRAVNGTIGVMLGVTANPTPEVRAFAERYQRLTGNDAFPPPDYAMETYDAARILFQVYEEVGTEPADVIAAMERVTDFQGITGTLSFSDSQRNALSSTDDYALVEINVDGVSPLAGQ